MLEAFAWGALGAATLLVGALIAYLFTPTRRVIAAVMALGTGLLIGSVSFELIDEALKTQSVGWVGLLVLVGGVVSLLGTGCCRGRAGEIGKTRRARKPTARRWRSCSARSLTAVRSRSSWA